MQAWAAMGLADGHTWAVFVMATAVLNATPGVDLLLVVSRTLQGGARAGCAAALGIGAGCAVHALAAALGLAAVLGLCGVVFGPEDRGHRLSVVDRLGIVGRGLGSGALAHGL